MKRILAALLILVSFLSDKAMSQTESKYIPVETKTWHSMGEIGKGDLEYCLPGSDCNNPVNHRKYVSKEGLVNPLNNACWAEADVNCSQFVAPGPAAVWEVRVRDGDGASLADVATLGATMATTLLGMVNIASNYFYNGTNFVRWTGQTSSVSNVPAATPAPFVYNFNYGFDGANWDPLSVRAAADNLSATQQGLDSLSFNLFYDGNFYRRWLGARMDADSVASTIYAPWTGSFSYVYNGGAWDRFRVYTDDSPFTVGTNSVLAIGCINSSDTIDPNDIGIPRCNASRNLYVSDPILENSVVDYDAFYDISSRGMYMAGAMYDDVATDSIDENDAGVMRMSANRNLYTSLRDGTGTEVGQSVLDANADNLALTLNPAMNACVMYGYDGATLDMARTSATGGIVQYVENWPTSEDQANGYQEIKKTEIGTQVSPKGTTATAGGAAATVVFGSREVLNDANWCIYYSNVGANPLTDADIQVSPEGVTWISLVWTTCDALAASSACVYCVSGNAYRYIRGRAIAGVGVETTLDVWYTSNKG